MRSFVLLCLVACCAWLGAEAFLLPTTQLQGRARLPGTMEGRVRGGVLPLASVRKVTGEELETELNEWSTPVLLDVFAQWCGPCQILAGELDKIAVDYGSKLRILKVDSDEEPRIASALRVYGLPTLIFLKDGQLVYRVEGALPASELTKLVDHHLFGGPAPPKN